MLLLALLLSQTPDHRLFMQPNLPRDPYAFFEAFPASGAGTTTACNTTAPTGAKGEVLTFTRASSATCTKTAAGGLATTGIANGDLVVLSSNVARVEYDSNGVLGLLVEAARTNVVPRSEEFDNASWLKLNNVVAAPTVTANTAVSPDGATTADTVAFPQVVGASAQSSVAYQFSATAAPWTCSVYVRSPASSSGRIYVSATVTGASFPMSAVCDHVSTSWTRCTATATLTAALYYLQIGIDLRDAAQATQAAQSVYMYGGGCEEGAYATSYIPTVAAAVTRAKENASFPGSTLPQSSYSKAVSIYVPWASANQPALPSLVMNELGASKSGSDLFIASGGLRVQNGNGTTFVNVTSSAISFSALVLKRIAASSGGGAVNMYVDGALFGASPFALADAVTPGAAAASIGDDAFGVSHLDGIISRICWDSSLARCR